MLSILSRRVPEGTLASAISPAFLPTYDNTKLRLLPDDEARGSLTSYFWLTRSVSDLIPVSNWCVAQKSDYEEIFVNLGSTSVNKTYDDNVNAYITTGVGGTAMPDNYSHTYWSATEYDGSFAWLFDSDYWRNLGKTNILNVRPVLGF